jgi:hypothetical protein
MSIHDMINTNTKIMSCIDIIIIFYYNIICKFARIAQLVEQWTENPRVTSSNLVLGIKKITLAILILEFNKHFVIQNN